jgi:hypothetical protein
MSDFRFKKSTPEDLDAADAESERSLAEALTNQPPHPSVMNEEAMPRPTIPSPSYEVTEDDA